MRRGGEKGARVGACMRGRVVVVAEPTCNGRWGRVDRAALRWRWGISNDIWEATTLV